MLMERLYGHMLGANAKSSAALRKNFEFLCNLEDKSPERSFTYRLEARVNLFQLDSAVEYLAERVSLDNFIEMDFAAFAKVFSSSVVLFRDAVTRCAACDAS
ncbi:hypothetical protein PAPHI01_1535 [Pancytospora philotis]|nr:hypothetical protein PAPHI01_1535 [Pancytospora philotis]